MAVVGRDGDGDVVLTVVDGRWEAAAAAVAAALVVQQCWSSDESSFVNKTNLTSNFL